MASYDKENLIVNIVETQRRLCNLIGVSGRENDVREYIYTILTNFCDRVSIDKTGNVIGVKQGKDDKSPVIMLDAHMDEIGIIIRSIDQKGFLRFDPVGGIDKRLFPGSKVLLRISPQNHISGIIGLPPPHITSEAERNSSPDHFQLFIDIGANSKEDVLAMGIDIGTTGVLDSGFEYIETRGILRGRAFDDRTGCNVLLQVASILSTIPTIKSTVYFVFSWGEEVGARGTRPASFSINPDIGIAIENTIATDVPGVPDDKCPTKLLDGPAISVMDNSCVYDERIIEAFKSTAEQNNIKYQYKLPKFGGTNAGEFSLQREGIIAGGLSVPCRYIHSSYSQLFIEDIVNTVILLAETVSNPISLKF